MFSPANGESNNLALEKIYGMLILQIRIRFGDLNYRDVKQLSHKGVGCVCGGGGGGGSRAP